MVKRIKENQLIIGIQIAQVFHEYSEFIHHGLTVSYEERKTLIKKYPRGKRFKNFDLLFE